MEKTLIAVPSNIPGGLDASPSAHFGHCDIFTVVTVDAATGEIEGASLEYNGGHEHGGCIVPVQELASKGVKVVLAGGMGMGPLNAMQRMEMRVFYAAGFLTVREAVKAFVEGRLQEFGTNRLCQGGCGKHGI